MPRVETPFAAFGGASAEAMSKLGNTLERSGDELFQRAYAIQQLNNQSEAQQAETDYMIAAGQLHADYNALKGKQAVDAFPKYQTDLKDTRERIRENMSNDASRKMFDSQSLSTMGRSIFNGAGHSATEFKSWQNGVSQAKHKAQVDAVLSDPDNSTLFAGSLEEARQGAISDAVRNGHEEGDEATKLLIKERQSEMWSGKIEGLSRKDPKQAYDLMKGALAKSYILGQDYKKLEPKIEAQLYNVTARNISDAVGKGWAPYVTGEQASRAGGVEQSLVDVVKRAQQNNPDLRFMIAPQGGRRSEAEQRKLFAQGRTAPGTIVTWTMQSEHLTGDAVDIMPLDPKTSVAAVRQAMDQAANELGVKLAVTPTLTAKDPGHFQLAKDFDKAAYKSPDETTLEQRQKAAADYVRSEYDEQKMGFAVRDRIRQDWGQQQTDQRHQQQSDYLSVAKFVYDNKVTNRDVVLNNPQLSEVYFRMDQPHQKRVDNLITALAKEPTVNTPEKAVATQRLLNMSTEIGGQRKAFMEIDAADLMNKGVISTQGMQQIVSKQRQIHEGQARDAQHLGHAISVAKDYLIANNIRPGSDEMVQFTGAMNQWVMGLQEQNKRPNDQEIRDKAYQLTQDRSPWYSPWRQYEFQPSKEFTKDFTELYKNHPRNPGRRAPSPEELARAYEYSISHPNWRDEILKK